jgi:hypothetical protein
MSQYPGALPPGGPYYGQPPSDPYAAPAQAGDPYFGQLPGDPYAQQPPPPQDPYYGQPSGDPYAQQAQYQVWQAQQQAYWQAQQPPPAAAAEEVRSGRGTGAAIAGIFLVLLGVWFLFREEISLDIGRAWPVMAVALGALMVIAAFIPRRRS